MAEDEENRSANLIACAIVCQVISGLFVGARFYSRSVVTRALAREDYCILASWVCSSGADGHTYVLLTGLIKVFAPDFWSRVHDTLCDM